MSGVWVGWKYIRTKKSMEKARGKCLGRNLSTRIWFCGSIVSLGISCVVISSEFCGGHQSLCVYTMRPPPCLSFIRF